MNHAKWLLLLLVLSFGATAAKPAIALSRNFMCFFDTDSDALTPRCERTLREFVDYWIRAREGRNPGWPIAGTSAPPATYSAIVLGHADSAEALRRPSTLSERRSRAVVEWLVAAGMPRHLVFSRSYGATCLLVPTSPGEPEPQNRRVEVLVGDAAGRALLPCEPRRDEAPG